MDYLTIARPLDAECATKTHVKMPSGNIATDSYPRAYRYEYETVEVENIHGLSALLKKLENDKNALVLRGRPLVKSGPRVYKEKENREVTFVPDDHRWVCIDIDDCEIDPKKGPILTAIQSLPDIFHTASCHYQYSSSMGIKGGDKVKVHLWFFFDRPVCGFSLRRWLKPYPVDTTLYNPVQPHYTATPIFIGFDDPLSDRSGMIHGSECVEVPDYVLDLEAHQRLVETEEKERRKEQKRRVRLSKMNRENNARREIYLRKRYAQGALKSACEEIESQTQGDRHNTIFHEAAGMGELYQFLDESEAKAMLVQSGLAILSGEGRDREVYRTVDDGWLQGMNNPRDLAHIGVEDMGSYVQPGRSHEWKKEVSSVDGHYTAVAAKMGFDARQLQEAVESVGGRLVGSSQGVIDLLGDLIGRDYLRFGDQGDER